MNSRLPRILVISTGGTIATRSEGPMASGAELVAGIPKLTDYALVEVLSFSIIGSYHMTSDYWLRLARKVEAIMTEDLTLAGVVITHGTDTMEETAFFLHLTLKDARPVVLTGAMRTADEVSPDGPANLINAVRVAADLNAHGRGVMLVMNETILSARDAWKSDNRGPETFQANQGCLGLVDPEGIRFYRQLQQPHTFATEFYLDTLKMRYPVDVVADFTGFDASILEYFAQRSLSGLIFQSMAGGRLSRGAEAGLKKVVEKIPVVISSKVPMGRIVGDPNPELPVIYARDLSTNRARILLMLGLEMQNDAEYLKELFTRY